MSPKNHATTLRGCPQSPLPFTSPGTSEDTLGQSGSNWKSRQPGGPLGGNGVRGRASWDAHCREPGRYSPAGPPEAMQGPGLGWPGRSDSSAWALQAQERRPARREDSFVPVFSQRWGRAACQVPGRGSGLPRTSSFVAKPWPGQLLPAFSARPGKGEAGPGADRAV